VKVRIGIAESTKVIELEVTDAQEFESSFTAALAKDDVLVWVEDAKKRRVGIPSSKVSYVEIETDDAKKSVGFGPS
jgi:disulfide oxidoreductase YuzD